MLYTGLVWESTLLLALCTDDIVPPGSDFSKNEMEKLGASDVKNVIEMNWDEIVTNLSVMENLTPIPGSGPSNMDVDGANSSGALRKAKSQEPMRVITQGQLKYIKSLLGASSRLGRALARAVWTSRSFVRWIAVASTPRTKFPAHFIDHVANIAQYCEDFEFHSRRWPVVSKTTNFASSQAQADILDLLDWFHISNAV
jgi:hypothetical protein